MDNTIMIGINQYEVGYVTGRRKKSILVVRVPDDDNTYRIGAFDSESDAYSFVMIMKAIYQNGEKVKIVVGGE